MLTSHENMTCSGSQSCQNSHVYSDADIHCEGKKSCQAATINSMNDVYCNGDQGCMQGSITAYFDANCQSKSSCSGATIHAKTVNGYGYKSVEKAMVYAYNINGFGAYSFNKAVIDSDGIFTLNVKLYGNYAGKGATIICRSSSDSCRVECRSNACKSVKFYCLDGANCDISPTECLYENKVDGIDCPKWRDALPSNDNNNETHTETENESEYLNDQENTELITDGTDGEQSENQEQNPWDIWYSSDGSGIISSHTYGITGSNNNGSVNGQITCGFVHSCREETIIKNYTYCHGYESCIDSSITGDHLGPSNIQCYGSDSCERAVMIGTRGVECNAKWSCRDAVEISTQTTYGEVKCSGYESCLGLGKMISSIYTECNGENSCQEISVNSFMNIQCNAKNSCWGANLISDNDAILCTGTDACMHGDLRAPNIVCSGSTSCEDSRLEGDKVKVYGINGANYAEIYASDVIGYGYYSLQFAEIDSMNNAKMDVSLFGHNAGYGATIICRSGSDCKLNCKSSGCFGTTFLCITGSRCMVMPTDCRPNDMSVARIRDIDCPVWKTALSHKETMEFRNLELVAMESTEVVSSTENYSNKHLILIILMISSICFSGLYCKLHKNGYESII